MREQLSGHAASFTAALRSRRAVSRIGICVVASCNVGTYGAFLQRPSRITAASREREIPSERCHAVGENGRVPKRRATQASAGERCRAWAKVIRSAAAQRNTNEGFSPAQASSQTSVVAPMIAQEKSSRLSSALFDLGANPSIEGTCNIRLRRLSPAPHVKR